MVSVAADIGMGSAAPSVPQQRHRRGLITLLALAAVAMTIAVSGVVFSEPAPVDALTMGLIVLLPVIGLVHFTPTLVSFAALWLLAATGALLGMAFSQDLSGTGIHVAVTLYLYAACAVLAAFVAYDPPRHARLLLNAWSFAALVAASAALLGYFHIIPGGYELFTEYGRATGTFKDPNVFAPFLIVPLLYLINVALERPARGMVLPLALAAILTLGVFFSFSRGAWINLALSLALYGYLLLVTTRKARVRLKLLSLLLLGALFAALAVMAALSSNEISSLLLQRASFDQSYDLGEEGRFGGQEKALGMIAEKPLGIGALEFGQRYHPEAAHNVYLTMFLNSGWLGGGTYLLLVLLSLVFGMRFAMRGTEIRPMFLAVYAAFVGTAGEGIIIDSDHWRHFYVLMALLWGMMAAEYSSSGRAIVAGDGAKRDKRNARGRRAPRLLASAGEGKGPAKPRRLPTIVGAQVPAT
ncbi:Permeases of the major facilitator superfamily [Hyphomicrobium sulfonivorans]|uniref:Permeases of the major facilitator superfamily n=1 Tax=Hyphomicrobium sulfonivorans TaxID=121290 RepID=A0A109BIS7_HYPSL|nr:O-antigen ligase family protein [Hyphomicrobium sulfonivorans]KWT69436.1 Permeases of the major facilitator superfamily [Hyphomicrobium sulfonivorans]